MLVLLLYQFQEKSQKGESPGRGGCCNTCHLYPWEVEGIMGNEMGMMQLKQGGMECVGSQWEEGVQGKHEL